MLQPVLLGKASRALGYTEGQDFFCTSGICQAGMSISASQDFLNLQTQLNRVAVQAGYAPIPVDGQIGPMTLAAVKKAISALKINLAGFPVNTVNDVAAQADWLAAAVSSAANTAGVPSVPARNASTPVWTMPSSSTLKWWLLGGAGALALGTATFLWARHHKHEAPPRRRGRYS